MRYTKVSEYELFPTHINKTHELYLYAKTQPSETM